MRCKKMASLLKTQHLKSTKMWFWKMMLLLKVTPPKINIEPENGELEDDFPFPGVYSQVPC